MAYKLLIEYDGTDFYGWQIQPHQRTVQGELLQAARSLFQDPNLRLFGASRTDRGVHAMGQVAAIYTSQTRPLDVIRNALNALTGPDVVVHEVQEVPDTFHPRYDALGKRYRYRVLKGRSPLRRRFVWEYPFELDFQVLQEIAKRYQHTKNFRYLSVGPVENPEVEIQEVRWEQHEDEYHFVIEADRFLYKMVRTLVGMAVAVASGRVPMEELKRALRGEPPRRLVIAPPQGLTLEEVFYPSEDKASGL